MIDLGLTKLIVVGVVALVVIGPERLPKVARTMGALVGRAQRYLNQIKAEVSREMAFDELHAAQKEIRNGVHNMIHQVQKIEDPLWNGQTQNTVRESISEERLHKIKRFHKKKQMHTTQIPDWYKRRTQHKTRVISGAARVAKYRATTTH